MYSIREIFDTLQGEGARAGRRSVFVRFSGCNLWNGRPEHRSRGKGACAAWCDTDFWRGSQQTAAQIADQMDALWPPTGDPTEMRWCVLSGGEPLLQVDAPMLDVLRQRGWSVALETNGSIDPGDAVMARLDWVTVSPKLGAPCELLRASEVKVVLPGVAPSGTPWTADQLHDLSRRYHDAQFWVQPLDPGPVGMDVGETHLHVLPNDTSLRARYDAAVDLCVRWVRENPRWGVSLQTHKYLNIP